MSTFDPSTVPILEGDPKYSKGGPDFEQKGDLEGTKKGTQNLICSKNEQSLHVETESK